MLAEGEITNTNDTTQTDLNIRPTRSPTITFRLSPSAPDLVLRLEGPDASTTCTFVGKDNTKTTLTINRESYTPSDSPQPLIQKNSLSAEEEKKASEEPPEEKPDAPAAPPPVPYFNSYNKLLWAFAAISALSSAIWVLPAPDNKGPSDISVDWLTHLSGLTLFECLGGFILSEGINSIFIRTNIPKSLVTIQKVPAELQSSKKVAARTAVLMVLVLYTALAAYGIAVSGFVFTGYTLSIVIGCFAFISNAITRTPSVERSLKNPPNPFEVLNETYIFQKNVSNLLYRMEENPEINQICAQYPIYKKTLKERLKAQAAILNLTPDDIEKMASEKAMRKVLNQIGEKYPQHSLKFVDKLQGPTALPGLLKIKKRSWVDDGMYYGEIISKATLGVFATVALPTFTQKCVDILKVFFPGVAQWDSFYQFAAGCGAGFTTWSLYKRSGDSIVQRILDRMNLTNDPWTDFLKIVTICGLILPTSSSMVNTLKHIIENKAGIFPWTPGTLTSTACLFAMRIIAWAVNANSALEHFLPPIVNDTAPTPKDLAYLLADPERVRLTDKTVNDSQKGLLRFSLFHPRVEVDGNLRIPSLARMGSVSSP